VAVVRNSRCAGSRDWAVQPRGTVLRGTDVPQDNVRAYMWVNLAAVHMTGDEQKQAVENRDDVARRMTPAQVAEAKRLTQQCQARKFNGC
jgi:hypothetical protein